MTIKSESRYLIKQDWKKVGKGFLIALAGGVVAFFGQVSGVIDYTLYGVWGPVIALLVATFASTIVNILNKWIAENTYKAN